jgi:hypothetical protein
MFDDSNAGLLRGGSKSSKFADWLEIDSWNSKDYLSVPSSRQDFNPDGTPVNAVAKNKDIPFTLNLVVSATVLDANIGYLYSAVASKIFGKRAILECFEDHIKHNQPTSAYLRVLFTQIFASSVDTKPASVNQTTTTASATTLTLRFKTATILWRSTGRGTRTMSNSQGGLDTYSTIEIN